jgi:uncharacterized membrane protein YhaH (DUF805 family)
MPLQRSGRAARALLLTLTYCVATIGHLRKWRKQFRGISSMAYEKMVDLVLTGDLLPGHELLEVKARMARTFKRSAVEVEHLFASVPFVVKKDLPESQLKNYLDLFASIGAAIRVVPASSVVALVGSEVARSAHGPSGAPRAAPPPFTSTEPLAPVAPGPSRGDEGAPKEPGPGQMSCPKCGHVQPQRTLCLACGTDMPRFQKAREDAGSTPGGMPVEGYAPPRAPLAEFPTRALPPVIALSVEGRIGRLRYLAWGIPAVFALLVALLVLVIGAGSGRVFGVLIGFLASAGGLIVILRLSILRLHDLGRSGWWIVLYVIPLVNLLLHIALIALPGAAEPNEYGPVPEDNTPWVYVGAALSGMVYLIDIFQVLRRHH